MAGLLIAANDPSRPHGDANAFLPLIFLWVSAFNSQLTNAGQGARTEAAMILGMSLATFTQFHVIISLIGILSGIVVLLGMLNAKLLPSATTLFLITTVASCLTGFMFPIPFDPPAAIGCLTLALLALAIIALYYYKLSASWRGVYVISSVIALYFNCFVLVVQTFQKVGFFHALAPTQKEPPFAAAQAVLLLVFIGLGIAAFKRFRPSAHAPAAA
jgi:hypothetical protein